MPKLPHIQQQWIIVHAGKEIKVVSYLDSVNLSLTDVGEIIGELQKACRELEAVDEGPDRV